MELGAKVNIGCRSPQVGAEVIPCRSFSFRTSIVPEGVFWNCTNVGSVLPSLPISARSFDNLKLFKRYFFMKIDFNFSTIGSGMPIRSQIIIKHHCWIPCRSSWWLRTAFRCIYRDVVFPMPNWNLRTPFLMHFNHDDSYYMTQICESYLPLNTSHSCDCSVTIVEPSMGG